MDLYTNKTRVIGVDISLERTSFAIVDVRGHVIASSDICTQDYPEIDGFIVALCDAITKLVDDNGGFETVRSVGMSCPSGNFKTGSVENSPNMPWKGSIPIAAMVRDRLGLAVAITNDSVAIAFGELSFGSAHGLTNFAIVTIGHGLGCAIFSERRLVGGNNGFAGELGHTCVVDNGRKCECGLKGCLETYVAEKGILRTARELMEGSDRPSLMRNYSITKLTPKEITDCCNKGDEMAKEVYRKTGYILGISLANLAAIIDPEAIILAGGIVHAGKWLVEPTYQSFQEHLFHNIRGKVKLIRSALNDRERDVLGASALAWNVKEYSLFK